MSGVSEPPEDFICPISLEIMTSPVRILATNKIYDNANLQTWFSQGGAICPMTGTKLDFPLRLRPQIKLRSEIEQWAEGNGVELPPPVYGKPEKLCESGSFVTRQTGQSKALQFLKRIGQFLISKRQYDCQLY